MTGEADPRSRRVQVEPAVLEGPSTLPLYFVDLDGDGRSGCTFPWSRPARRAEAVA